MKYLYLVRHAKSYWGNEWLDDFERPLNKRGKHDAPLMGKVLSEMGVRPERILSSPAARASATARMLATRLDYPLENIDYREQLYDASSSDVLQLLSSIPNTIIRVMVVAHNPGITILANRLTNDEIDNVPTTGVVGIEFDVEDWATIPQHTGQQQFFEYPKKNSSL